MRCDCCGRLLIAKDARIAEALDSRARVEYECECGAIHSAFIGDSSWYFGLAWDDAPGLICHEEHAYTEFGVLRWLIAFNLLPKLRGRPERAYIMFLAHNYPRPLGRQAELPMNAEYAATLPEGIWLVLPNPKNA